MLRPALAGDMPRHGCWHHLCVSDLGLVTERRWLGSWLAVGLLYSPADMPPDDKWRIADRLTVIEWRTETTQGDEVS